MQTAEQKTEILQIFNRYEKKYLLDTAVFQRVLGRLESRLVADRFGDADARYTVNNLYLDTDDDWFIRNSLRKPRYKEKLRLRCYGDPGSFSPIYFEIKKKCDELGNKRRVAVTMEEAEAFIRSRQIPGYLTAREGLAADSPYQPNDRQIYAEIARILDIRPAYPKVMICYDRAAYYDPASELRITFDSNLRARRTRLDFESGSRGTLFLPPDRGIMEIKVAHAMPVWLTRILSELDLRITPYSKIGSEYRRALHAQPGYGEFIPDKAVAIAAG
ncbi:MAG: polyphosphate polymerase domain-containing protein [Oscillospiraceae bacterium]|nr:polyphosphate polymerase domain-containing protein [Oscillospiraceae bacterium]